MENYYNKKSIWKWIVLYVILGAIAYGAVYYFLARECSKYTDIFTAERVPKICSAYFYSRMQNANIKNQNDNVKSQNENNETADSSAKALATEDLKTYTNNEYGYEIKYPNNWDIREYVTGASFYSPENLKDKFNIDVYIGSYTGIECGLPFYEFVKKGGTLDGPDDKNISISLNSIEKVLTEDKAEGYKTIWNYTDASGNKKTSLYLTNFRNNKNCLTTEINLYNSNHLEIYNKIISTFKFIK